MNTKQIFENTELQLIKSLSDVKVIDKNYVYYSNDFPNYYGGNGFVVFNDLYNSDIDIYNSNYKDIILKNKFKACFYNVNDEIKLIKSIKKHSFSFDKVLIMKYFHSITKIKPSNNYKVSKINDLNDILLFDKAVNDIAWFWGKGFEKKKQQTKKNNINWIGIYIDNELLSCMGYFNYNNTVRLQDVETKEKFQKKGFASILINYIIEKCATENEIFLYVDKDNIEAISFYRKNGFKVVDEYIEVLIEK